MFNKKTDPLVDPVSKILKEGVLKREVIQKVNEAFGVHSRNALPNELYEEYDSVLEKSLEILVSEGMDKVDSFLKESVEKVTLDEQVGRFAPRGAPSSGPVRRVPAPVASRPATPPSSTQNTTAPGQGQGAISGLRKDQGGSPAVASRPATRPAARKPAGVGARQLVSKVRAARKSAPVRTTANQDFMSNLTREETETPPQIKESFERFLRTKFLKD